MSSQVEQRKGNVRSQFAFESILTEKGDLIINNCFSRGQFQQKSDGIIISDKKYYLFLIVSRMKTATVSLEST
jgi:hypothetical protein